MNQRIERWQELSFGMFIHLGVYSMFGGVYRGEKITKGYSEQIMQFGAISKEEYLKKAREMHLECFHPDEIVSLAKKTGMTYLLFTSKHHDGFCMFDTKTTDFNVMKQTPFRKDMVSLLSEACKRQGLGFGIYFSLVDWNLGHEMDPDNWNKIPKDIEEVLCEQLEELMTGYGPLCEVWFDMSRPTLEQSKRYKAIVRKHQPLAMINSRIGHGEGDFITFWDNEIPEVSPEGPWQTPQSIYPETWGYRSWQEHEDPTKRAELLFRNYHSVISRGGNYLLNIGPKGDGSVSPFEVKVLEELSKYSGVL